MFYIPHHQNIFVSSHPSKGLCVKHKKPFASLKYLFFFIFWCCLFARNQKTNFLSPRAPGSFYFSGGLSGLTFVFAQSHFSGTWAIKIPTLRRLSKPITICAGIYELSTRLDVLNKEIICFRSILGSEPLSPGGNFCLFILGLTLAGKSELCWWAGANFRCAEEQEELGGSSKCGFSAALGPADVEIISCLSISW